MNDAPQLKEVSSITKLRQPGDFCFYRNPRQQVVGFVIVCLCGMNTTVGDKHKIVKDNPLTVTPSLLHSDHGCHYNITDGKIIYA